MRFGRTCNENGLSKVTRCFVAIGEEHRQLHWFTARSETCWAVVMSSGNLNTCLSLLCWLILTKQFSFLLICHVQQCIFISLCLLSYTSYSSDFFSSFKAHTALFQNVCVSWRCVSHSNRLKKATSYTAKLEKIPD